MDRESLLAKIFDDESPPVVPPQEKKRRGVIRRPLPKPVETPGTPREEAPVDLNVLLDQMTEMLAQDARDVVVKGNDVSALTDLEDAISELIRQNSSYGVNWHAEHLSACSCQQCDISRISVQRFSNHDHLCSIVKGQRICENPTEQKIHTGPSKKDESNYYLCEQTGMVHLCGDMCRANKDLTNQDNEYVCPISGLVLGVELKGEWWTDKDKQNNDTSPEPEMDQDAWEVANPRYVIKRVYDEQGNCKETMEYAAKNIIVTHHLHYHNHPFEKKYWYYLMRCKNILWLILYSAKRQQIERQRVVSNYQNMEKNIDKYIRNCEKNKAIKSFHEIRAIVRYNMKPRTDIPIWVPPLRIMEPLLFRYARIIVKFFWIILEKTSFGRTCHTQLPFDYFVLATINIMRTRGLIVQGSEILPQIQYLTTHIPDPSLLHHFGIQLNFMTRTRNHINKAIGMVDPKLLKVTVTDKDSVLFQDTRERRIQEFRYHQEQQRIENSKSSEMSPKNKRKKK